MKKTYVPPKQYDTELVLAASAAAYRANLNQYVNSSTMVAVGDAIESVRTNKEILIEFLNAPEKITEEDRARGSEIRRYYQGLSFKILKGRVLGDLDYKALSYASGEQVSERDFGILAYMSHGYTIAMKNQTVEDRLRDAAGGLVGKIGDRVTLTVEVLRCVYSMQWRVNFVTGLTEQDQPVFFSFKSKPEIGSKISITGTVKAHRDDQTQLNRVSYLKK